MTDVEAMSRVYAGFKERPIEYVATQGIELSYSEKIAPAKGLSSGRQATPAAPVQRAWGRLQGLV